MKTILFALSLSLFFILSGCVSATQQNDSSAVAAKEESREVASAQPWEPLLWEQKKKDDLGRVVEGDKSFNERKDRAKQWTAKLYELIPKETVLTSIVPTDVEYFCPRYAKLNASQRGNFWAQLIAAISYKESGWVPTNRTPEKRLGIDAITRKTVASEGLMQLSYQDAATYKQWFDCGISWENDRKLKLDDPNKTIFGPFRNLRCGLLILNHRVKMNTKISTPGTYWSVLRPKSANQNSATKWLAQQTRSLSFCK